MCLRVYVRTVGWRRDIAVAVPRAGSRIGERARPDTTANGRSSSVKRRSGLGIAIGGLAAVALSGAALAFSGPTNASFETGAYVANGFGYERAECR